MKAIRALTAPGLRRIQLLVASVIAVAVLAATAVFTLQHEEHEARDREVQARVYAMSLQQSVDDLVPVGYALADRDPELIAGLVKGPVERAVAQLEKLREFDPERTRKIEPIVFAIRDAGVIRDLQRQYRAFADVTRAAKIAQEIAARQHTLAERAELRSMIGSGLALGFAILVVFLLVLGERRRGIAEHRAHMAAVRRMADHDSLTGLPNRRRFDADLDALEATDGAVEIAVCDLNGFKEINDRLGHDAGDTVLITVARDLQAAVGDAGTVYRTGGDEFCVVSAPGVRVADLARAALERDGSTTVGSVGAATLPTDHTQVRDVVRLADRRMYDAKRAIAHRAGHAADRRGPAGRRETDPVD